MPLSGYLGDDRYYGRGTLSTGQRAPVYAGGGDSGAGNLGYMAATAQGRGGAQSRSNAQDIGSPQPGYSTPSTPTGSPNPNGQAIIDSQLQAGNAQIQGQQQQAVQNAYYQNTYPNLPSVQATPVNAQDFGPTGGANNPVQHQGTSPDPYDYAGNYEAYYGRPFDPSVMIPTAGGQNDTAIAPTGATYNYRPVNNATSADYDAWRVREYGPSWDNNSPQNRLTRQLAAQPGSVTPATLQSWLTANR